jgi:hypothetical protein
MTPKFIQFNITAAERMLVPISSISRIEESYSGDCIVHLISGPSIVTTDVYASMLQEMDQLALVTDSHERVDLEADS